nr:MAG TPA: hypothetical protein [Caudoviricetes sp.]
MLAKLLQYGGFGQDRNRPTLQMDVDSYINLLSSETNFVSLLSHGYRRFS